jgi:4-diphosphocytidyl-2C-methyl-D-erythritol kinase
MLIQANAKINLSLKILGKLPNGYHKIDSIMQSIDLADFLHFEKSRKSQFSGTHVCPLSKNLIIKAQRALERKTKRKLQVKIHLQKQIPISAGLGGGSADAAATLVALDKIYKLDLPIKKLSEIAMKIGADVPFFLHGGTCKIQGIGEKIIPTKRKISHFYVVARPHKRIDTKMMYKLYDKTGKSFLELVKKNCPSVGKLYSYFKRFKPQELNLSGSGPSVFCGVRRYETAREITEGLKNFDGDIFICHSQNKSLKIIKT